MKKRVFLNAMNGLYVNINNMAFKIVKKYVEGKYPPTTKPSNTFYDLICLEHFNPCNI